MSEGGNGRDVLLERAHSHFKTVLHSQQVQQVATSKGELNRPNVSCIFCTAMGYGLTVIVLVLCTNHYMSFWWHTICFHFCHFIPIRSTGYAKKSKFHLLAHEKFDLYSALMAGHGFALNPLIYACFTHEDV